ncbi:hypothetical protein ACQJBY_015124 [Aegilops geniculata]
MELDNYYETIHKRDIFMLLFGLAAGFMFGVAFMLDNPSTDYYSVNLTGITASSPTSPPAFNFTLHVENKGLVYENCFSHGQAAVSYAGVVIGEGRVPGVCAEPGRKGTAEVTALAHGGEGGAPLPDSQRKRLEDEMRRGSAEFDVEAKLFRDGHIRGPVVLWCKLGLQELQQPSDCKSFTDLGRRAMEQFWI